MRIVQSYSLDAQWPQVGVDARVGERTRGPNFDRFARRAVTFDKHYVGSLPCMPARRDIHTGRLNFMHRSWGPLEPFDNSMPEILNRPASTPT